MALALVGCRAHRISVLNPDIPRNLDGVIISGGDDSHPSLYSTEDHDLDDEVDPERDQLEIQCINTAFDRNIPILGICRGAQLINVVNGGSLHPDINHLRAITSTKPHLYPHKRVTIEPQSLLANIITRPVIRVNSLHHQAVKDLGDSLKVVASDRDNIVQAIEHQSSDKILGVQWHPEYLFFLPTQLAIFRWFKD
ncbi:MAG: gamma-glutamyl-gamma-aminobutyrate hydrolase family protein [Pseudomonadales bacterium]|nr:gamma-glutamyl-gamma-aminobutyrate hydrolase family protein [Pseudomonadales bacterium]